MDAGVDAAAVVPAAFCDPLADAVESVRSAAGGCAAGSTAGAVTCAAEAGCWAGLRIKALTPHTDPVITTRSTAAIAANFKAGLGSGAVCSRPLNIGVFSVFSTGLLFCGSG